MPSQLSPSLEQRRDLADVVRAADRVLMPMLSEYAIDARALWDLAADEQARDVLKLILIDPWGSATGDFAPSDLQNEEGFWRRAYGLVGELIRPRRTQEPRERIELRDAFISTDQLEALRRQLGQIPDVNRARLRLYNQVRLVPQRPDSFLLTDFSIEVNEPFAAAVREAVVGCGFRLREDPWLIRREGVREALLRLIDRHRREGQPTPEFALCFLLQDRETIHLLEVSSEVPELADSSLDGVALPALGVVPYARTLKIYLTHPNDLRATLKNNPSHPLVNDLRNGDCDFLLPDDRDAAFWQEFSDLARV